jgi:hypothetical protein
MAAEKQLWDESESIQLIRSMIETTRYQIYQDRMFYFLWGYATLLAAGTHYVFAYVLDCRNPAIAWLLMPIAAGFHISFMERRKRKPRTATFAGRLMVGIWGGLFLGIMGLVAGGFSIGFHLVYPCFLILYGVACFASGTALQFRYLVWGGIGSILLGTSAFFVSFQYQLLLLMVGIVISYILPAHLMRPKQ